MNRMITNIKLFILKATLLIFTNSVVLVALVFVIPLSLTEPIFFKERKFRDIPKNYKKLFDVWRQTVSKILSLGKKKDG